MPEQINSLFNVSIPSEIFTVLVAFIMAIIAKKVIAVAIDKYFSSVYKSAQSKGRSISRKRIKTLSGAFKSIANMLIWLVFVLVVLGIFNVKLGPLLTGAGATAIIFGIAGRDIIMDLYVGFMALIEDQYRVGDDIEISKEHSGTVEEITLRTVKLRDSEGNVHIVPHSLARSIINKTYDYSHVNLEITVKYIEDVDKIKHIINETGKQLATDDHWKKVFVEQISYLTSLGYDKKEITFKLQGKVKPGKQLAAESEFLIRINESLEKNGISMIPVATSDKVD
ncbi:MAG: mechanosensitive ion channel family protein [Patescibacteria group bacterium]|jgi:small conductance mechanosensitive channel|nr:mechanosensitive ion channel family protein [Patescibacteria group bacterium]